ncbi:MAG: tRNA (adenosine(37)-N6)-threonylcarbamoyltransferase complex ATPase subunit type 1 TsaE [Patescibacteria group bacterium]|nr:tRNA (adenosine(37)-N6)-threonylcarbamoyltransferase complex ATPase subunit type 1 TsaE [Patescibacteria group bacterium]
MRKAYLTSNPSQTKKLGEILAKEILKTKPKKTALVIGLKGVLGGGKTTFLKGFAKGLGIKEKILSPTFVIVKRFQLNNFTIKQFNNFYHIDCYRIKKPKEILDLGFKEIIKNPQNIVAIEWADHIEKILPKDTLIIKFEFLEKNIRKIKISD